MQKTPLLFHNNQLRVEPEKLRDYAQMFRDQYPQRQIEQRMHDDGIVSVEGKKP